MQKHETSRQELDDLRAVVERDLSDAALPQLSEDRSFATAYNAALQLAKMAIACAGYRVTGRAHHVTTFQALTLAMGPEVRSLAGYLDICRRKRNIVDYGLAWVATEGEAEELLRRVHEFKVQVEEWISHRSPRDTV